MIGWGRDKNVDLPMNFNTQKKMQKTPNTNGGNPTTLALLNSLSNTQRAIAAMSHLSNNLSLVTEKYIDALAKTSESNDALKEIEDVVKENYSDDIELKTLVEKALNRNTSSESVKYIQNLHELGALASIISNGIKKYDGDVDFYYEFKNKLNNLGLS
jgi:hypothetical protein